MIFSTTESPMQYLNNRGVYVTEHSITSHPRDCEIKDAHIEYFMCMLQDNLRRVLLPEEFERVKVFRTGNKWTLSHDTNPILTMHRVGLFSNKWRQVTSVTHYRHYDEPISKPNNEQGNLQCLRSTQTATSQ